MNTTPNTDSTLRDTLAEYFMATSNDFITIQDRIESLIALKVQEARILDLEYLYAIRTDDVNVIAREIQSLLAALQKTKGEV